MKFRDKRLFLRHCIRISATFLFLLGALFFLSVSPAGAVTPTIIYVDASATGSDTGLSWTDAYTDFQDGINNATSSGEVWVASGTYMPGSGPNFTPPLASDRYFHFSLKDGVSVYGGFAGTEVSRSERDPETNLTYLSGDIGTPGDTSDNCYHVFYHNNGLGLNTTALLDGFIISDGNANHASEDINRRGGGMYNHANSPTVSNCLFTRNNAVYGGGMRNWASSPVVSECYFTSNTSTSNGAAMYNQDGAPQISSSTFSGNSTGTSGAGGGIYNYFSTPVITGCTFDNNFAGYGGGIWNTNSSPPITNCTFDSNTLNGYNYEGRAIGNQAAIPGQSRLTA